MLDELHDTAFAADYLKTPPGTLVFWRHKGIGPKYARIGKRVFYRESDLRAFVDKKVAESGAPSPAA